MQPRVTVLLVVRDDDRRVDAALAALRRQTRMPDAVLVVDAGRGEPVDPRDVALIEVGARSFPGAVDEALASIRAEGEDDWIWLLPGNAVPEPTALAGLLGAIEIAPSVAVAGPKLVDPGDRALLRSFGESLTRLGATMPLVDDDLDQGQHDVTDDVLGVVAPGMLVRRSILTRIGGFDPGLPTADAGLDLSVRARLAGARVVRVPTARVAIARHPDDPGRRTPVGRRALARANRRAQLHRRLVYAGGAALPLHWISLVPLALLRALFLLLAKRPTAIGGDVAAAFAAAFDPTIPAARLRLRRARRLGWAALAPLRLPSDVVRERRATLRERADARLVEPDLVRASFLPGGLAVVALAGIAGLALGWRLVGATALEGGALLPVADGVRDLWSGLGWGPLDALGLVGPADPFHLVLAVLGSLTAWNPSLAVVVLWTTALPLAALGAWWSATRLSERSWPPVVAAVLWCLAPPFLAALTEGRLPAVLVHLLLPWLAFALLEAARSWSAAGAAALLFAAVGASSPVLVPALVAATVAWGLARPRGLLRILGVPLPAIVLVLPIAAMQIARGTPLGSIADPGPIVPFDAPSGWQLLLGLPSAGADAWEPFAIGLPAGLGVLAPAVLLAPFAVLALLSLFLPGASRAIPAFILALAGLGTALAGSHLLIASAGSEAVAPWPGSGLSLYWLGLTAAVVVALEALGRAAALSGIAVIVASAAAIVPVAIQLPAGTSPVSAGDGRVLPALVVAEAATSPGLGTLVLRPLGDGTLGARVERDAGVHIDDTSTFAATRPEASDAGMELAELAGNLASRSGSDPSAVFEELGIGFVLLVPAPEGADAAAIRQRAAEALDGQPALQPVGETSFGLLWEYPERAVADVSARGGGVQTGILAVQATVLGLVLLLAIPTRRRRRTVRPSTEISDDPTGFEEDEP